MRTSRERRSQHTPAANGSKWIRRSTRWAIYARDSFTCVYCAEVGGSLSLDHVHACEIGGLSNPANLVTCCFSCNSSKQGKTKRAWFAKLRARGIDTNAVRRELARRLRTPINREVGRFLAAASHLPDPPTLVAVAPVAKELHVCPRSGPWLWETIQGMRLYRTEGRKRIYKVSCPVCRMPYEVSASGRRTD